MGWESSLMSWFDIGKLGEASSLLLVVTNEKEYQGKLGEASSLLLVVGSVLVGFTTAFIAVGATGALTLAVVFGVAVVASLAGVTSVSFLPILVAFCVVSFAFVCLPLSCVVSWVFVATTFSSALVVVATVSSLSAVVRNVTSEL